MVTHETRLHPVEELARACCVSFGKDWCNGYISIPYEGRLDQKKKSVNRSGSPYGSIRGVLTACRIFMSGTGGKKSVHLDRKLNMNEVSIRG